MPNILGNWHEPNVHIHKNKRYCSECGKDVNAPVCSMQWGQDGKYVVYHRETAQKLSK